MADVKKLLEVLHALVDTGNSMVIIEHNLDVIKSADWLSMAPEAEIKVVWWWRQVLQNTLLLLKIHTLVSF